MPNASIPAPSCSSHAPQGWRGGLSHLPRAAVALRSVIPPIPHPARPAVPPRGLDAPVSRPLPSLPVTQAARAAHRPEELNPSVSTASTPRALFACLLALLLPGGGHLFLGRRAKGLTLLFALLLLFAMGVAMEARLRFYWGLDDILAIVIGISQAASGGFYAGARWLGFEDGRVTSVTFDYGNTFTAVAGLLNMLVILDVWDTARGRRP